MGALNDQINADLKTAMLSGDKKLVEVLRVIKSAVLYSGVESGNREDINDEDVQKVLKKESKRRQDAIDMYAQAGENERQAKETYEKDIIDKYLPASLSEDETRRLVDQAIEEVGSAETKNMGIIISKVREKSNGQAEGALIAKIVKEKIS